MDARYVATLCVPSLIDWRVIIVDPPVSLPPHYRSKNIAGLVPNTGYYFRVKAETRMGASDWSDSSKQILTKEGLPNAVDRPVIWNVQRHSVGLYWYAPNPTLFGSGARTFFVHTVVNGMASSDESSWKLVTLSEGGAAGRELMDLLVKRKEEEEMIATGRKLVSQAEFSGSVKLSSEDIELVSESIIKSKSMYSLSRL